LQTGSALNEYLDWPWLRNGVISLLCLHHFRRIPDAFDFFAARPAEALAAIDIQQAAGQWGG
jgi:hypothetical protein